MGVVMKVNDKTVTQYDLIIKCLKRGWKSPANAYSEAGTMKLATRVGELRRKGYLILDKWHPSKAYKLYKLVGVPNV